MSGRLSMFFISSLATLGVGRIPLAPGTWGSLLAALLWWGFFPLSLEAQQFLIIVAFVVGTFATYFYEKWSLKHDPKEVVVDELVGMWIVLYGADLWDFSRGRLWVIFVVGFLFFRFFDIWKPFPIGWIDKRVPGAFGTMLDDVIAGVFGWIVLYFLNGWSNWMMLDL